MTPPRHGLRLPLAAGLALAGLALWMSVAGGPGEAAPMAPEPLLSSPRPAEPLAAPPPPAPPAPVAAPPSMDGLRLHGLSSGAAIIALPSGRQRLVRAGQEVVPGVRLETVAAQHVLLAGGSERLRLTFTGVESVGTRADGVSPAERSRRAERIEQLGYVTAMRPRTGAGGAVTGYTLGRNSDIALLRRAGLREGDVLVSVNGQAIDGQERLTQIPAEVAGLSTAEIAYERGGRPMRATVTLQTR